MSPERKIGFAGEGLVFGLVSADRWRMCEWRLAAQQQRKRIQAQNAGRTAEARDCREHMP